MYPPLANSYVESLAPRVIIFQGGTFYDDWVMTAEAS